MPRPGAQPCVPLIFTAESMPLNTPSTHLVAKRVISMLPVVMVRQVRRKVWPAFPEPFQRFLVEKLEMLAGFLRKPHFRSLSGQAAACSGLNPDVHSCQLKL
jgi:hypothetical protein